MTRGFASFAQALGAGWERALAAVTPALDELASAPLFERPRAVLNGLIGDRLLAAQSPLAIKMELRRDGKPLELKRERIAAAIPAPSSKVLLLVHGLCMSDLSWRRGAHDHGASLERDLGYTALYLRYNSGLHVSENGREAAHLIEALLEAWPVPIEELAILAHSMGGLVARSAVHYGRGAGHAWPDRLQSLVFLGTPHQGVPLERLGHWLEVLWDKTPFTAPFAKLGKVRSAGITDLRYGYVLDEDWQGRDRFEPRAPAHRPLALPALVDCYAIAGALGAAEAPLRDGWIGDGLVPVASALGLHPEPSLAMGVAPARRWTAYGTGHLDLLGRADVYAHIRDWLAERRRTQDT